jgi:amino acid permease
MTRKAQTKNENVLKIYATSISTAAYAPELISNELIKTPKKYIILLAINTFTLKLIYH